MSIRVPIDELFAELDRWGDAALITIGDDGPRVVTLIPQLVTTGNPESHVLRFDAPGRSAVHNVAQRPTVTLFFPARPDGDGYSLIVDGTAQAVDDGDALLVVPTSAVRHRPAPLTS